jgi:hypothetical protein
MSRAGAALRGDRALEILAVLLLGIATIGSAWCGYQASRWNGEASDLAREASNDLVEANRLFAVATQTVTYDASMVAQYARAFQEENEPLMTFYRSALVLPSFLPILDAWEAEVAAGRPPANLFTDEEYIERLYGPYRDLQAEAQTLSVQSQEASDNADAFVLTTLIFASALFFAGVTSSFRYRSVRILLLIGAVSAIAYAAARLIDTPVV